MLKPYVRVEGKLKLSNACELVPALIVNSGS